MPNIPSSKSNPAPAAADASISAFSAGWRKSGWASDNTEAFDRLHIQEGFTQAYAPKFMSAWVTDVPNMNGRSTPLQYRFLVAMQGALGIGANLNKFSAEDTAMATKMVATYKRIRNTVQLGDLYRLYSPRSGDIAANQYVAPDSRQSVVFVFRHSQEYLRPPRLPSTCKASTRKPSTAWNRSTTSSSNASLNLAEHT